MQGAVCKESNNNISRSLAAWLFMFFALFAASSAFCQDDPNDPLRKFEKGVKNSQSQQSAPAPAPTPTSSSNNNYNPDNGYSSNDSHNNDLGSELTQDFFNFGMQIIADEGNLTFQRLFTTADPTIRRDLGDILIPFVRYDFSYQSVDSHIYAIDNRVEAGIGPAALLFEEYTFHNQATGSTLTIDKQMFLYRMSGTRDFELDIGMGQSTIAGLERTPMGSFSLPVKIKATDSVTIEFIPTWSGLMSDYDAAVHWGTQYGSLKIGYRYLTTTGAYLKGPYAGFALYY